MPRANLPHTMLRPHFETGCGRVASIRQNRGKVLGTQHGPADAGQQNGRFIGHGSPWPIPSVSKESRKFLEIARRASRAAFERSEERASIGDYRRDPGERSPALFANLLGVVPREEHQCFIERRHARDVRLKRRICKKKAARLPRMVAA